jgi:phosphohistidine swiveling domain-containing protein
MFVVIKKENATPASVGMKAWNLFNLSRHVNVPGFAVMTTAAFKVYKKHGRIPADLKKILHDTLREFLMQGTVVVRSSGIAEDLPDASFAGMYETTLGVRSVSQGMKAVIRAWRSVGTPRVTAYCREKNISPGEMAVIIQQQLDPDVSGVMVTQSPYSRKELLIECCAGLGDKLVSGTITPTRYALHKNSTRLHNGDDILTRLQLNLLKQTGKKIETLFGHAQDIEWAFADGKLYILQTRTVSTSIQTQKKDTVYCNANVRETIPDPVSPMGYSIFDTVFFPSIVIDTFGFPISREQYREFRPVERVLGRFYWNVNNTAAYGKSISPILELMEGDKSIDPQFAEALRSIDAEQIPAPLPAHKMVIFSVVAMLRLSYFLAVSFIRFRHAARKVQDIFTATDAIIEKLVTTDDFKKGVRNVKEWLTVIMGKVSKRYFGGVVISVAYMVLLGRMLSLRMGRQGEVLARMTAAGLIDKTGAMVLAIRKLAESARKKLTRVSSRTVARLYASDDEFRREFDTFINEFGHRGPAEFDIASINWREDFSMVFQLLATTHSTDFVTDRSSMLKELLALLRPMERFFTRLFLPRIEALTPLREDGKHHVFKVMAKVKDQLFVLEKDLLDRGFLQHRRDIFFLTLQDLEKLCDGMFSAGAVRRLVRERKKEWNLFLHADVPDIIYADGTHASAADTTAQHLSGTSVSFGIVTGRARVIRDFKDNHRLKKGEILVTHHTDPGWTPLFSVAAGVIIEVGGVICHAAMVARELGIPALVLKGATTAIEDGKMIELDANEGRVRLL